MGAPPNYLTTSRCVREHAYNGSTRKTKCVHEYAHHGCTCISKSCPWPCTTWIKPQNETSLPHAQVLCIRGFLAARKHADRILLLVEMLGTSGFPCFKAGPKTVYALRRRFALQATEPQVLH